MAQGRLIWPFLAEIFRLDTAGTAGLTPPTTHFGDGSGYDPDYREPVLQGSDKIGTVGRKELAAIQVPVQVEDEEFELLRQQQGGNVPNSRVALAFHSRDLRKFSPSLIGADGHIRIPVNSRLERILDLKGNQVWKPANPPGLYLTQIRPASFGLSSHKLNLYQSLWEDREVAALT